VLTTTYWSRDGSEDPVFPGRDFGGERKKGEFAVEFPYQEKKQGKACSGRPPNEKERRDVCLSGLSLSRGLAHGASCTTAPPFST